MVYMPSLPVLPDFSDFSKVVLHLAYSATHITYNYIRVSAQTGATTYSTRCGCAVTLAHGITVSFTNSASCLEARCGLRTHCPPSPVPLVGMRHMGGVGGHFLRPARESSRGIASRGRHLDDLWRRRALGAARTQNALRICPGHVRCDGAELQNVAKPGWPHAVEWATLAAPPRASKRHSPLAVSWPRLPDWWAGGSCGACRRGNSTSCEAFRACTAC